MAVLAIIPQQQYCKSIAGVIELLKDLLVFTRVQRTISGNSRMNVLGRIVLETIRANKMAGDFVYYIHILLTVFRGCQIQQPNRRLTPEHREDPLSLMSVRRHEKLHPRARKEIVTSDHPQKKSIEKCEKNGSIFAVAGVPPSMPGPSRGKQEISLIKTTRSLWRWTLR